MSQQKQAPLPRQEFQEWLENAAVPVLVLQKGKHLGSVVKVPATPEIDYLFGCETFYGERISWSDRLEFCGLYDRQHQALHLLDDPLPNFVSGLTEEECQDSTAFGKRIAQEVDRYVEAAISNERSRLSVRELTSERNINSYRYYKGTEAGREAASLVFSGEKPDVQFHSEYYTSLTEDTLLSYLKSPEDYIKTTAEQYMRDNQEEFLAQFLKKDALLAEYQMLSQDSDAPVYRMRAITDALQKSGAKTVNVTVQKDGVELTFKTSAESLKGLKSQYSTWYIAPSDRLQFRHLFGAGSDYSAEDVLNAREDFDRIRSALARDSPASDVQRAAWFYQLIRYSYASGLTSFGSQPHDMRSNFSLIEQAHRRLAKVVIENKDFEKLLHQYDRPVSFFYLDPPYHATEGYYQNIGEDGFTEADHIRLRDALMRIEGKFLLSYNDDAFVRGLYDRPGIYLMETTRINNIKQRYDNGAQFPELLIANYDLRERSRAVPSQMTLFDWNGGEAIG